MEKSVTIGGKVYTDEELNYNINNSLETKEKGYENSDNTAFKQYDILVSRINVHSKNAAKYHSSEEWEDSRIVYLILTPLRNRKVLEQTDDKVRLLSLTYEKLKLLNSSNTDIDLDSLEFLIDKSDLLQYRKLNNSQITISDQLKAKLRHYDLEYYLPSTKKEMDSFYKKKRPLNKIKTKKVIESPKLKAVRNNLQNKYESYVFHLYGTLPDEMSKKRKKITQSEYAELSEKEKQKQKDNAISTHHSAKNKFLNLFEKEAYKDAINSLESSKKLVAQESKRYNSDNIAEMIKEIQPFLTRNFRYKENPGKYLRRVLNNAGSHFIFEYPILADPMLDEHLECFLEPQYSKCTDPVNTLKAAFKEIIDSKHAGIAKSKELIKSNKKLIWELPSVLEITKKRLDIAPLSPEAIAITNHVNIKSSLEFFTTLFYIGSLLILGTFTGGAGAAPLLARLALFADFAYETYSGYKGYKKDDALSNTHFDPVKALSSEDPDLWWLAFAILEVIPAGKMAHHIFKSLSNVTPKNTFELIKNGTRKSSEITEEIKIKLIEIKSEIKGLTQRQIDQIASNVEHNLDVLRGNKYNFAYEMAGTISKPTREFLEGGAKSDVYNFVLMFAKNEHFHKLFIKDPNIISFRELYKILRDDKTKKIFIENYQKPNFNEPINTEDIFFTQQYVKDETRDGRSIFKSIEDIKEGRSKAEDFPTIRLFKYDEKLYTLDNRRLYIFKQAGVKKIKVKAASASEIAKDSFKLSTLNWGKSVEVKITE